MSSIRNVTSRNDMISAQNDEIFDLIVNKNFNRLSDETFDAIILTGYYTQKIEVYKDNNDQEYYFVRIRSTSDDSDIMRLDPYESGLSQQEILKRINNHRLAICPKNTDGLENLQYGHIYRCRYGSKGYGDPIIIEQYVSPSNKVLGPSGGSGTRRSRGTSVGAGSTASKGNKHGLTDTEMALIQADYTDWYTMGTSGVFDELFTTLISGESPNYEYNDFNLKHSKPKYQSGINCDADIKKYYGIKPDDPSKKLTARTIFDVMQHQQQYINGADNTENRLHATGAFQCVQKTLKRIANMFGNDSWSKTKIYNKGNQKAICVILMLGDVDPGHNTTSKILGGYFEGKHDNAALAAHVMSKIWASVSVQAGFDKAISSTDYNDKGNVARSYYKGDGVHEKIPPIDDVEMRDAMITAKGKWEAAKSGFVYTIIT